MADIPAAPTTAAELDDYLDRGQEIVEELLLRRNEVNGDLYETHADRAREWEWPMYPRHFIEITAWRHRCDEEERRLRRSDESEENASDMDDIDSDIMTDTDLEYWTRDLGYRQEENRDD